MIMELARCECFRGAWPICPVISLTLRNRETGPVSSRSIDSFQLRDSSTFERIGPFSRHADRTRAPIRIGSSSRCRSTPLSINYHVKLFVSKSFEKRKRNTIPSLLILRWRSYRSPLLPLLRVRFDSFGMQPTQNVRRK